MSRKKREPSQKALPRKRPVKAEPQGFYDDSLSDEEKERLPQARQLEGLNEEIALLRVKLSQMLAEHPDDMDGLIKAVRLLVQAVAIKYRLSPQAVDDLCKSIAGVVNGIGGMMLPEAFKPGQEE